MSPADKVKYISRELRLSHIGSCLSVLPILEYIYKHKSPNDKVILDGAHAHLSHLVVKGLPIISVESLISEHGIHCDRKAGCDVSGGSLGHGIGIGIGLAIANPDKTVHVIVTDGSMHEGSNWEALRIKNTLGLYNLRIYCNFNGFSAIAPVNIAKLEWQMSQFCPDITVFHTNNGLGHNKVDDHYTTL